MTRVRRSIFSTVLSVVVVASTFLWSAPEARVQEPRFFPETGFSISNVQILNYFESRGGVAQLGFPISREFILLGDRVQIFQRHVVQIRAGSPTILNLLGSDLMPFTSINGTVLPEIDPALTSATPAVGSPNYDVNIIEFVKQNAPDTFEGLTVNFGTTFFSTVSMADIFPGGGGDPSLLPLIDLEMWGVPISRPAFDPSNFNFVFQRFQRNLMHFDRGTGRTQGVNLAQFFKALITGDNLPSDLEQQAAAAGSPFLRQYNNDLPLGLNRPEQLPNTNMKGAFDQELPPLPPGAPTLTPTVTRTPTLTPTPGPATPTPFVAGPNCNFDAEMIFIPQFPQPNNVVTITVTSPTSYNSVNLIGPGAPHFIGAASGGLGFAWKWRVLVTEAGLFNYDFLVNATQLCATGFFVSGGSTPTPGPTSTATPTVTPTPTATATTAPAPSIISVNPPVSSPRGAVITIVGTNFGANQTAADGNVVIGGAVAGTALNWNQTSILVPIPSTAITGPTTIQVVANGRASNAFPYTVN